MNREPVDQFCEEMEALIESWRDKPMDYRLTIAEMAGVLEVYKHQILSEAFTAVCGGAQDDED